MANKTPLDKSQKVWYELNQGEIKLVEELRKINYGKVEISMQDGVPIRIEFIKESILL